MQDDLTSEAEAEWIEAAINVVEVPLESHKF